MTACGLLLRELRLAMRAPSDTASAVLFFVIAGSLVPLAVGPDPALLARIAPGTIWVCALLSALLSLERLFGAEFADGSLDHLLLSGLPAAVVAAVKAVGHWLTTGVPLLLAAVPLGAMFGLPLGRAASLWLGLVPGTMLLSLLGATGAALAVGARSGSLLLPLLVLPLSVPVLILGVAAGDDAAPLFFLLAYLAAAIPLCPLAAGAALRAAAA